MAAPPSLGDEVAISYSTVVESTPLPKSRQGIVEEVRRILDLGRVQRLVVQVGKPLMYERLVEGKAEPAEKMPDPTADELYGLMRNGVIANFEVMEGRTIHEWLFFLFHSASNLNEMPVGFLVKSLALLIRRLGLNDGTPLPELLCIPVFEHGEIPDDILVLVTLRKDEDLDPPYSSYRVEL